MDSVFESVVRVSYGTAPDKGPGLAGPALPGETVRQAAPSAEDQLRARHHGVRVLLAEDDAINQELTQELVALTGIAVDVAGNGAVAVDAATRSDYAVILMDMQMPVMDGLEATRCIRRIAGREEVPIIAMTGNAYPEDRARCREAGMDDFIAKPVDPEALFAILLKWLPAAAAGDPVGGAATAPASDSAAAATRSAAAAPVPAAPTPVDAALARVAAMPGMDVARCLAALRGDADDYLEVLRRFVKAHADDMARLSECLASGDRVTAQRIAHTLKGTGAMLGADRLAAVGALLERALRENPAAGPGDDDLRPGIEAIGRELAVLVAAVLPAPAPQDPAASRPGS